MRILHKGMLLMAVLFVVLSLAFATLSPDQVLAREPDPGNYPAYIGSPFPPEPPPEP